MKAILLIVLLVQFVFSEQLRRDNGREVVISSQNRLMWMDTKDAVLLMKSQKEATQYCEELSLGGSSDWRLPSMEEFETIVDKKNEPTYINKAFRYSIPVGYWSNNVKWRTLWFYADYMHFLSGTAYYDNKHKPKNIRCVREY